MLKEFLAYLENEVKNGSIYVWGGQGQKATEALIDRLETTRSNAKRAKDLLTKRTKKGYANIRAFDCSGLITAALAAADGTTVRAVDVPKLQKTLREQGVFLG